MERHRESGASNIKNPREKSWDDIGIEDPGGSFRPIEEVDINWKKSWDEAHSLI